LSWKSSPKVDFTKAKRKREIPRKIAILLYEIGILFIGFVKCGSTSHRTGEGTEAVSKTSSLPSLLPSPIRPEVVDEGADCRRGHGSESQTRSHGGRPASRGHPHWGRLGGTSSCVSLFVPFVASPGPSTIPVSSRWKKASATG
jgi:hypothetical protein